MRPRYYLRTVRPHVWAVMRRSERNLDPTLAPDSTQDTVDEWVSARDHGGDDGARAYGRTEVERLNREEGAIHA